MVWESSGGMLRPFRVKVKSVSFMLRAVNVVENWSVLEGVKREGRRKLALCTGLWVVLVRVMSNVNWGV